AIANSALSRCLKDGGSQGSCEGSAIRQASAVAKRIGEAAWAPTDDALTAALVEAGFALEEIPAAAAQIRELLDPADPGDSEPPAAVDEAATTKAQAQAVLRDVDALLGQRNVSAALRAQLQSVRDALKQRWVDLAGEDIAPTTEAGRVLAEAGVVLYQDD